MFYLSSQGLFEPVRVYNAVFHRWGQYGIKRPWRQAPIARSTICPGASAESRARVYAAWNLRYRSRRTRPGARRAAAGTRPPDAPSPRPRRPPWPRPPAARPPRRCRSRSGCPRCPPPGPDPAATRGLSSGSCPGYRLTAAEGRSRPSPAPSSRSGCRAARRPRSPAGPSWAPRGACPTGRPGRSPWTSRASWRRRRPGASRPRPPPASTGSGCAIPGWTSRGSRRRPRPGWPIPGTRTPASSPPPRSPGGCGPTTCASPSGSSWPWTGCRGRPGPTAPTGSRSSRGPAARRRYRCPSGASGAGTATATSWSSRRRRPARLAGRCRRPRAGASARAARRRCPSPRGR